MSSDYDSSRVERAHHWMVKALDTLAEARELTKAGKTRLGAYSRLYYAAHHTAVALLNLEGRKPKTHKAVLRQFGALWVKKRGFPDSYGRLLKVLFQERRKADYGDYLPTWEAALEKRLRKVELFIKRAQKEVPPVSMQKILRILVIENPSIRDFSFDFYCPKSYHHHTRFTIWCPRGRATDRWLRSFDSSGKRVLQALRVKESKDYVIGLNSRVNQYAEKHILMLDFDDVSTVPTHMLKGEPGFLFRTGDGFHFIGCRLYDQVAWLRKMKKYSAIASKDHYVLSKKRGYATLRITTSSRKPIQPAYMGRTG